MEPGFGVGVGSGHGREGAAGQAGVGWVESFGMRWVVGPEGGVGSGSEGSVLGVVARG